MQPIGRIRTTKPALGQSTWVLLEGRTPPGFSDHHESIAILNANERDAGVQITVFFDDRGPVGPYRMLVPAGRIAHKPLDDLIEPGSVPPATHDAAYALVVSSDRPIVVQQLSFAAHQAAGTAAPYPVMEQ
jgi:hypothetical protein